MRAVMPERCRPVLLLLILLSLHAPFGASATQQQAARSEPRTGGTASIHGLVTTSDTGQPIPSVQIRLTAGRSVSAETSSDAAGRYQFTDLDAGSYALSFAKSGFVSVQFGQKLPSDPVKRIDLKDGQKLEGVDIALIRAGAIEGRVSDENGEPLVEANVSAMRLEITGGERRLVRVGRAMLTNDKGDYRVYGLPPGEYCVSVGLSLSRTSNSFTEDPSHVAPQKPSGYASMFYPSTADAGEAGVVTVRPGQTTSDINIVFRPVRLARVAGTVISARGKLLDGTLVNLWRSSQLGNVGTSLVTKDGAFTIPDVPPGQYTLRAVSVPISVFEEIAATGHNDPLRNSPDLEFGTQSVTVAGIDITDLAITTAPGGRIRGRVRLDGRPFTPGQAKVVVEAHPVGPDSIHAGATADVVANDGTFDVGGLIGKFVLRVSQLATPASLASVDMSGSDVTDTGIPVRPSEVVSDIEVLLTRIGTQLKGQIVTSVEGQDLAECTVVVFAAEPDRWSLPFTRYVSSVRPDRTGSFLLAGLPPGRYLVSALPTVESGRYNDPKYLKSISSSSTAVVLENGRTSTVSLRIQAPPR